MYGRAYVKKRILYVRSSVEPILYKFSNITQLCSKWISGRNKTTIQVDLLRNMFQFNHSKVKFTRSILTLELIYVVLLHRSRIIRISISYVSINALICKRPTIVNCDHIHDLIIGEKID